MDGLKNNVATLPTNTIQRVIAQNKKAMPMTQGLGRFSKFAGGMPPKQDILAQRDLSKLIFRGDISSGEFDEDYM